MTKEQLFTLPCVLFAGGKSSRMGRDKSLLPFGGYDTLVEYQYRRLSELFTSVFVSVKHAEKLPFAAAVIEDPEGEEVYAPTAGFVAAFEALQSECIFVLSVDTPFVGKTEIAQLLEADRPELDAVIAESESGMHPMCGIYHRSLQDEFTSMLQSGSHRLGQLLKHSGTRFVRFDNEQAFTNINHPHEYEAAVKMFRS